MIELKIGELSVEATFPEDWDQLSKKQWMAVQNATWAMVINGIRSEEELRNAIVFCADCDKVDELKSILDEMDFVELCEVFSAMDFQSSEFAHKTNHVKRIGLLRGPDRIFTDTRWKQYGLLQEFLSAHAQAIEANDLKLQNKYIMSMIAVAYRPWLMPWSSRLCDLYLKIYPFFIRKRTVFIALKSIYGMMNELKFLYPLTFEGNDEDGDSDAPNYGFRGLSVVLADGKFGDYYKLQRAFTHDVMVELENAAYMRKKNNANPNAIDPDEGLNL